MICLRNSQGANVMRTERAKGKKEGMNLERWLETGSQRALLAIAKILDFILNKTSDQCRVLNRDISNNVCSIGRVCMRSK